MVRATSETYLRWVNEETGQWGMWEPYDTVNLGDVGYFNTDKNFIKVGSANSVLGLEPVPSPGHRVGNAIISQTGDFSLDLRGATTGGSAVVSLRRGKGHILYIQEGQTATLSNEAELVARMHQMLADGRWRLDWVLVTEHLRAPSGFAAMFKSGGSSVTFDVAVPVPPGASLGNVAHAGLAIVKQEGKVSVYPFSDDSTPTFDRTWRVYPDMRNSLYGGNVKRVLKRHWYFRDLPEFTRDRLMAVNSDRIFEFDFAIDSL